jgi:uncharacterized membrane protein YdjX (TVP38/TMEM64 family)
MVLTILPGMSGIPRLAQLKEKVTARGSNLFNELLFLRLVPFTPNWLLNICLPLLEVPIHLFFLSIFFGMSHFTCVMRQSLWAPCILKNTLILLYVNLLSYRGWASVHHI